MSHTRGSAETRVIAIGACGRPRGAPVRRAQQPTDEFGCDWPTFETLNGPPANLEVVLSRRRVTPAHLNAAASHGADAESGREWEAEPPSTHRSAQTCFQA
jgi:hypothetical protein